MRTCEVCLEVKSFFEFSKKFRDEEELRPWCKSCVCAYSQIQYKKVSLKRKAQRRTIPLESISELRAYHKSGKYQQKKPKIFYEKKLEEPLFSASECRDADHLLVFD
jgi:hypothetical protein